MFIKHVPCPKCGSRDNLALYSDGSEWCFGCRYHKKGTLSRWNPPVPTEKKPLNFPTDAQNHIPVKPLTWIKQYGITDKELVDHHVSYSDGRGLLLFPIYGDINCSNLIGWQGRNFGSDGPKWYSRGPLADILHIIPLGTTDVSRICCVEDIVSAIKVGRHTPTCPIFGSNISLKTLVRLSDRFKHLTLWLDKDKEREALKTLSTASLLPFDKIDIISTDKDPKALTDKEIMDAINN